jgi:hypothetical protein
VRRGPAPPPPRRPPRPGPVRGQLGAAAAQGPPLHVPGRRRHRGGDDGEWLREGAGRGRPRGVRRALPQQRGPDHGAVHEVVRRREAVPQADPHHEHAHRPLRGCPGRRRVRLPPRLQEQHRRHVQGRLGRARPRHQRRRGPRHLVRRLILECVRACMAVRRLGRARMCVCHACPRDRMCCCVCVCVCVCL